MFVEWGIERESTNHLPRSPGNACGLFFKLHGKARPVRMRTDVVKRRNRTQGNQISSKRSRSSNSGRSSSGSRSSGSVRADSESSTGSHYMCLSEEKLLPFLHPALKIDKEGSKRSELWATDSISGKWEDRSEKISEKVWRWTESGMKLEELVSVSRFQICSKSTSCELDKLLICYQLAMIRGFYWVFERVPKECSSKVEWKKKKINLKRFSSFLQQERCAA